MNETLDFPEIVPPPLVDEQPSAPPPSTSLTAAHPAAAPDLAKVDLTDVALARFGNWQVQVAEAEQAFKNVVFDLSTQAKIDEAKSQRWRLVGQPRADVRKVSKGLKSKLSQVSKAIGATEERASGEFDRVESLITPQIEAREAELEAEKAKAAAVEQARKDAHIARIQVIYSIVEKAKGLPVDRLEKAIAYAEDIAITSEAYEEFTEQAEGAKADVVAKLQAMLAAENERLERMRVAADQAAEALRLKEAAEALAAQHKAEADRLAAEQKKLAEERAAFAAEQEAARLAALPAPVPAPIEVVTHAPAVLEPQPDTSPEVLAWLGEDRAVDAPPCLPEAPVQVAAPAVEPAATLKLGEINARLAPISISADGLKQLGFEPVGRERSAVLFLAADLERICAAISTHALRAAA